MDTFGSSTSTSEVLRPTTAPSPDGLQLGQTSIRPSKAPKTRSRTGCLTCRKRKHKCGEERIGSPSRQSCERCLAAGLNCVWPTIDQLPKGRTRKPTRQPTCERDATASLPVAPLSSAGASSELQQSTFFPLQVADLAAHAPLLFHPTSAQSAFSPAALSGANTAHDWSSFNAVAGPSTYASISTQENFFLGGIQAPEGNVVAATPTHNWQLRLPEDASSVAAGLTLEAFGLGNGSNGFGPMSPGSAWLEDVSSPVLDLTGGLTPPACLPPEPPQSTYDACDGRAGPVVAASDGRGADGWLMNPPRFVAPTPTLELLYRNPEERALIQFFLVSIPIIFIGRPQAPRGTIIPPPSLLPDRPPDLRSLPRFDMLLPYFDIPHFLSLPRGSSMATDALALAVMSMSAIHLAHLHWTNGLEALRNGDHAAAARAAASEKKYRAIGRSFVSTSLSLVRSSIDLLGSAADLAQLGLRDSSAPTEAIEDTDDMTRLLVACSFAVLTDCISGGSSHLTALSMAKEVVDSRGGARLMLASMAASISSTRASPLSATRRRRLRLLRSVLEELVSWELVTTLSTGTAPNLFATTQLQPSEPGDGFNSEDQPAIETLKDWFFAFSPPSGSRDTAGVDWETVETCWGSSRIVMFLFARVNTICAAARAAQVVDALTLASATAVLVEIGVRKADLLRAFPELLRSPFPPPDIPVTTTAVNDFEKHIKYGKLGAGSDGPNQDGSNSFFEPRRARRLEFGDMLWCSTFEILLRVDAQGEATDSPVIRSLALRILELVIESHARKHVQVGYGWPIIIAGAMLDDKPSRQKVRTAMSFISAYCLFESVKASAVIEDLWALRDSGDRTMSWRDLAARDGGFAFA